MSRCSFCNSLIIAGGVHAHSHRFCGYTCESRGNFLAYLDIISLDDVLELALEVRNSTCGVCHQRDLPVDFEPGTYNTAYFVWGLLHEETGYSRWHNFPSLKCGKCPKSSFLRSSSKFLTWNRYGIFAAVLSFQKFLYSLAIRRFDVPPLPSAILIEACRHKLAWDLANQGKQEKGSATVLINVND